MASTTDQVAGYFRKIPVRGRCKCNKTRLTLIKRGSDQRDTHWDETGDGRHLTRESNEFPYA
jgi:hypothetical protein